MPVKDVMTGCSAAAYGAKLARPKVVSAYPITPSTPTVERIASFIMSGELDAQYIPVESEHTVMGACIGASLCGVRTFTATASQGLAYMHEFVYAAHGYRLPIVMAIMNRTLATPWATLCDYSDSMGENTSGWIQLYAANAQEVLDTIIQAYRIGEDKRVLLPIMVCSDGFLVSHTSEVVEIPDQELVDKFLPPYKPDHIKLDPEARMSAILPYFPWVIKFEHATDDSMNAAKAVIKEVGEEFGQFFDRKYSLLEMYRCDDAEALLLTMGSMSETAKVAVDEMRDEGLAVGVVRVRSFRPFPNEDLRKIAESVKAIAVVDRNVIHGIGGRGGAVFTELKSSLYDLDRRPNLINFVAGIAGRDITVDNFKYMAKKALGIKSERLTSSIEWLDEIQQPPLKPASLEKYDDRVVCPGTRACAGCGMLLAVRTALEICFAGTAAVVTGMKAALKTSGKDDVNVLGLAGDGGTADIGFQALSAAAERGESIIYLCYDNEAYINTGNQKSGTTPFGAQTTTTPAGARKGHKKTKKKDMPMLMAAHGIPYVATASIAYISDFRRKMEKAAKITREDKGLAYVHIHAPCYTGWGFPSEKTVEVARLAVQTGMWKLYEIEDGNLILNTKPAKRKPVAEYLKMQGRFSKLTDEEIQQFQVQTDQEWEDFKNRGLL
jgi:pyruvate ferredoxin oxidoreductase alpha subunit